MSKSDLRCFFLLFFFSVLASITAESILLYWGVTESAPAAWFHQLVPCQRPVLLHWLATNSHLQVSELSMQDCLYHCGRDNGSKEEHPPTGDLYIPSSQCSTPPTSTKPAYNLCSPTYGVMFVYQCLSTTICSLDSGERASKYMVT